MDDQTDTIRRRIGSEREQLGRNVEEIEDRVKNATDLKTHFNKNTGLVLGAVVAGGFLLSLACRSSVTVDADDRSVSRAEPNRPPSKHVRRVFETLDNILEGLIAVASGKVVSFVAGAIPAFKEHYDGIDEERGRSTVVR